VNRKAPLFIIGLHKPGYEYYMVRAEVCSKTQVLPTVTPGSTYLQSSTPLLFQLQYGQISLKLVFSHLCSVLIPFYFLVLYESLKNMLP